MDQLTLFRARRVATLDPARPTADAILTSDGRIVAVGSVDELAHWGDADLDETFADSILAPGFVEAHSHVLEGGVWAFEYVGYFDRVGPDGLTRPGCQSVSALIERLRQLDAAIDDPSKPLVVWGFDPIHLEDERLGARHLDRVSEHRPIFIFHASGHLATVNTALMREEGFAEGIEMEGVPLGSDGRPLGELQEGAAISLARSAARALFRAVTSEEAMRRFGMLANRTGTTTVTDLGTTSFGSDHVLAAWERVTGDDDFPARVSVFYNPSLGGPPDPTEAAEFVHSLRLRATDRLRLGQVKLILDGSIQGFTARVGWPGYLGDRPNGIWLLPIERVVALVDAFHCARITVHAHCNGDEAVDVFLDAVDAAQSAHPWFDHRHTVQHCQLTTPAQYRRMASLGCHANIFANHIFYWGDQHASRTVGPDRAARMDACATAQRSGVPFSIHSDASITPLGQLHTMWCAVNRLTASGVVLGAGERISAEAAWNAVTLGAARQLRMDHEIGSIEAGKRADFAAIDSLPTEIDAGDIRDVVVTGTVLGGRPYRCR